MGNLSAQIKMIGKLPFWEFKIPPYQRPYRWGEENVIKLLSCLKDNIWKEKDAETIADKYRIGSIIVHHHIENRKEILDIVDGQQRLTTLSLLLMQLDSNTNLRLTTSFKHLDSKRAIYRNYQTIDSWLELNIGKAGTSQRKKFAQLIRNKCSVVYIEVEDLGEAFQMFDSQNGRGEDLKGYDLLKAYHIRAIDKNILGDKEDEAWQEKMEIDRAWVEAVDKKSYNEKYNVMEFVFNLLYRTRIWAQNHPAYEFGRPQVGEFKGVKLERKDRGKINVELPCQNLSLLMYLASQKGFLLDGLQPKCRSKNLTGLSPYVNECMQIVDGKIFFDYVQTFIKSYQHLFGNEYPDDELKGFRLAYKKYCLDYEGSQRVGDTYIRWVYMAVMLAVFDKFGDEGVINTYKHFYSQIYVTRLKQQAVFYETMANQPKEIFAGLYKANTMIDLKSLAFISITPTKCYMTSKCKDVALFIQKNSRCLIDDNDKKLTNKDIQSW